MSTRVGLRRRALEDSQLVQFSLSALAVLEHHIMVIPYLLHACRAENANVEPPGTCVHACFRHIISHLTYHEIAERRQVCVHRGVVGDHVVVELDALDRHRKAGSPELLSHARLIIEGTAD